MRNSATAGYFSCVKKAWCPAKVENGSVLTVLENPAYLGPACHT
ncbi:hypothetical protein [Rhizobium mongolense]